MECDKPKTRKSGINVYRVRPFKHGTVRDSNKATSQIDRAHFCDSIAIKFSYIAPIFRVFGILSMKGLMLAKF